MDFARLILDSIIILLGLYLILIKSYYSEKGKNLATKEDIKEITDKMESVKLDYLRRIEEYKKELNIKYELEKTLINSKVKAYQIATTLKETIIRRKSNFGIEKDQMQEIFENVPELLIHLNSQVHLKNMFQEETKAMQESYNGIVLYIEQIRTSGKKSYVINLDTIDSNLEKIQEKLLQ